MNLPDAAALHAWLGRSVVWRGQPYQVIEILDDGPALVLEGVQDGHHIQADAHGRARREARASVFIAVRDQDGRCLHPDFVELEAANP